MELATNVAEVRDFLARKEVKLSSGLNQAESQIRPGIGRIGAQALEQHLGYRRPGHQACRHPCSCCDVRRFVGYRRKALATLLESAGVQHALYRRVVGGAATLPYDQQVGLGDGQVCVGPEEAEEKALSADGATWSCDHIGGLLNDTTRAVARTARPATQAGVPDPQPYRGSAPIFRVTPTRGTIAMDVQPRALRESSRANEGVR